MALTITQQNDAYNFFIVAFGAAPGTTYMDQLNDAYASGMTTKQIVNVYTTKAQFTSIYPNFLSNSAFATSLVNNVVKTSATDAAKAEAVIDIQAALNSGMTRGDVITQVFTNLINMSKTDAKWGSTATLLANEVAVAQYYTETLLGNSTDITALRAVVASVTATTDVSSPAAIAAQFPVAAGTFTLTKGLDNIVGTAGNDTIIASVDSANAELQTMSPIDSVNGGAGTDTLKIVAATALASANLANISNVEIIEASGAVAVTLDTSAIAGVTNLNVVKAGGAVSATGAAATDVSVALKDAAGIATVDVAGGKNVSVKLADAVSIVNVGVANAADATGAVVVEKTAAAAANGVAVNTGAINVTGGTTINVTQKAGDASALVAGGATATHTQGNVTVTGNAATTAVNIKADAAVAAVAGNAATAAATEVASVKFVAGAGAVTVGGLTFTPSKALTANEVAQAFANLSATAPKPGAATGDTQGSGIAANGTFTGSLAALASFNSAVAAGDTVVFTAAKAGVLTDLTATGATVTTTTQGVAAVAAVAAKLGVAVGTASVTDSNATIKTISVDGYSSGTATTTSVLETLTLKNGGSFTAAASNATVAVSLEKIAAASNITLNAATTLNVNTIGANHAHINGAALETLNVSGTGVLQTESMSGGVLKTVTVSGTAGLILATNQSATVTSVNTTATTGTVTSSIDGTKATYTGGAGMDVVALATGTALTKAIGLGAGDDTLVFGVAVTGSTAALNGGDGVDTLSMSVANADALDNSTQTFYTNFERLTLTDKFGVADPIAETLTLDLAKLGFTNYVTTAGTQVDSVGAATATDVLTLGNMANNGTVVLTAQGSVAVEIKDALTGTADSLNVVLSSTAGLTNGVLKAANVETINISTVDTEVVVAPLVQTKNVDTLTLTADKATAVNLSGAADLTLDLSGSLKVVTIDASAMTGGLTVTSLNTTAATTITGGSGNDVLTAAAGTTSDKLVGGAGNDTLVANSGLSMLTGGAGNDIFKIGFASLNVNSYATVTDFTAGDVLELAGTVSFAASKVVLGGTAVFQDYANAIAAGTVAGAASWFQFGGDTYVIQDNNASVASFTNGSDFVVKLTGLVDLSNASFNNDFDSIALA